MSGNSISECVFCAMLTDRSRVPHWIAESDRAFAFLSIGPIRHGHSLVIPKTHAGDLAELAKEDLRAVTDLVQEVARLLRHRLGTAGENLFVASGPGSEQGVVHLHVHIIPRTSGDDLRWNDWFETKICPTTPFELESLARKLRQAPPHPMPLGQKH